MALELRRHAVGRFFSRQTIGVVRTSAREERSDGQVCVDYHGGWVLTETVFLGLKKRRAVWFGDALAELINNGRVRAAAVGCWLKGGPVPTQYLDAPAREKPKLHVTGGTDGMRR